MQNRITELFKKKKENILNIYFTAGYPQLEDTRAILRTLQDEGVDMVELGMPYSDPLADGPIIQASSEKALKNGMTIKKLFEQLKGMREEISIPVVLMGYLNPVLQYGIEKFIEEAASLGIDGLIIPDLPYFEYTKFYKPLFEKHQVSTIFLITPQTSDKRIEEIDRATEGFVYIVSTNSTTGNTQKSIDSTQSYLQRVKSMSLKNPTLIGFNIKDQSSFKNACQYANGAIIGSAFVKTIAEAENLEQSIAGFVSSIK